MAPRIVLFTLAVSFLVLISPVRAAAPVAAPTAARPLAAPANGSPHEAILRAPVLARNFNGVVVDEAGAPVPQANVTLYAPFFMKSVSTGPDGQFWLLGESVGDYLLIARNAAGDRQAFRPREPADGKKSELGPVRLVLKKARSIETRVADQSGKPIADVSIAAVANALIVAEGRTDTAGNAFLRVPADLPLQEVFALKKGFGVDSIFYRAERRRGKRSAGTISQNTAPPSTVSQGGDKPLQFQLTAARTVRVHVVDQNGKPIAGLRVGPNSFWIPNRGFGGFGTPSNDAFEPRTDAAGAATLGYLPTGERTAVGLVAQTDSHWAATQPVVGARSTPAEEATIVVYHCQPVRGTVVTPEGKPVAEATLVIFGTGYLFDDVRQTTKTDSRGAFEVWLQPETYYAFEARGDKEISAIQHRVVRVGSTLEPLRFVLERGTRVHGRVVRASDKSPVSGAFVRLQRTVSDEYDKLPKEEQLPNSRRSQLSIGGNIYRFTHSGPDGQFEFYVAPGQYNVQLNTRWSTAPAKIDVARQKELVVDLVDNRPEISKLEGRVVLKSDRTRGVPHAQIKGADVANNFGNQFSVVADGEGRFEVERGEADMVVLAASDTLAGAVRIKPADKTVTVPVGPTASATGTLIDEATGQPAANHEVSFGVRLPEAGGPFSWQFPQTATTDAKGRFNVKHLAVGLKYDAHAETERNDQGPFAWHSIADVLPKDAHPIDLGECKLPAPYRPQTLDEQITRALESKKPLDVRLGGALEDARLFENRVLIVAVSPKSVPCRRIFAIQYGEDSHVGDEQAREALGNFTRLSIDASAPRYAAELTTFLARWNLTSPASDDALLAVIDQQGRLVSATTAKELWPKRIRNGDALAAFLKQHEGPVPDAQQRLAEALAQAKREHKRVLVEQSASWCGWCHVLAKYFDRHRSLIEKDYVWIVVDPRFTHGEAVIRKLRPKAEGGIPWMVILDADGKPLITSDAAHGNIGYPGEPKEITHFEKMLRTTARHLSESEIKLLLADAAKK